MLSRASAGIARTIGPAKRRLRHLGVGGFRMDGGARVGAKAPDFALPSQSGERVRLGDSLGRPVVLFFYPKDDTPGCTKEVCAFRDDFEQFGKLHCEVIGVSSDSVESHKGFAEKHDLPFALLSDVGGKVRRLYGVPNTLGLIPGRVTYVIDERGVVRHVFSSQLGVERHVRGAIDALRGAPGGQDGAKRRP
jgi:thioredoxin-dependent peroxiredoxin